MFLDCPFAVVGKGSLRTPDAMASGLPFAGDKVINEAEDAPFEDTVADLEEGRTFWVILSLAEKGVVRLCWEDALDVSCFLGWMAAVFAAAVVLGLAALLT